MFVLASALLTVVANLAMRAGIGRAGGFALDGGVVAALMKLAAQPLFDLGFLCYGLAALCWFRVVGSEPLTLAYPMLVSTTFILVSLGAVMLFGEPVSARKAAGLAIILVGILVAGGS
jgi:multidrug transporter EmrE-like cation transporter